MPDLDIVGGAAVDVVPIIPNFHTKLKALVLPIADKVGAEAGRRMGEAISNNIVIAIPSAINQGGKAARVAATRQGSDTGGAFARSLRTKLEAAFKAMPKLDVKLSDTGVDAELSRIRAKLEQLKDKRVGIDVGAEEAAAEAERLEEQLRRLGASHPNVRIRVDTAAARAALREFREEIAVATARPGTVHLEVDGALGRKVREAVAQAQAALPEINITADTDPARAEVQALRAQLETLKDVRVGIDMPASEVLAKTQEIQARLDALDSRRVDIDVRADVNAAAAHLAALQAEVNALDKHIRLDADINTGAASGALMNLGIQMAVLTAIPLGPVLAAGLGGFVSMLTAASVGVGAFAAAAIPAVKGVTEVLGLQKQAQQEANRATDDSARKAVQSQQRAIQMASAQQALTAAHRNAARSIAQANAQVEAAERAVAQASQRAADQRRQSAQAVEQAERSLADAKRGVQRAEQSLADAQINAKRAQQDLTQARVDAAKALRDLDDRLADGQLSQREATLRVQEAQQELQAVMADPRATDLQQQRAQLALDQARQAAKEQKQDYEDLQKEAAKQKKAGVEGSDAVKNATDRLHDAQRDVKDQTQAVADAQRNVRDQIQAVKDAQLEAARAQKDAAQAVVDAQRGVADATANAADAQVRAAESIESAERGVESARLSGIDTTSKAVSKQDEYRKKLAELSKPQRDLYESIAGPRGLKKAFTEWSKSLQPDVLPILKRGVDGLKKSLPFFTPIVRDVAKAIGELMDKASKNLKTPFWKGFKDDLQKNVKPAVVGFGVAFGNVITGIAGIIDAFLPHMGGIADESDKVTGKFAKWGKSLKGSPDFEKFLDYVKRTAPGLGEFLGDLFGAMIDVAQAASPLSSIMFDVFTPLLDGISWLAQNAPEVIQLLWGMYFATKAISIGLFLISGAAAVYESAMAIMTLATVGWGAAVNATGIVPIIRGIMLIIGLLVLAVILAWKHWGWFRDAVRGAWDGIKIAASFAWNNVLKPIFDGIGTGLKWIGDKAIWLWKNAFQPAFHWIGEAAKFLLTLLLTIVITPIYLAIKALGLVAWYLWTDYFKPAFHGIEVGAKFLWEKAIKPIFGWIGDKAKWLYDKAIRPAFRASIAVLGDMGDKAKWLWDKAIRPACNWIADKAKWLYDKGVKPPFDLIKKAVGKVADAFEKAKDDIKTAWDKVWGIVKKPVKLIVDIVYNHGILPVWNAVAGIVGAKKLDPVKGFHTGGIMSGYSPGRDDRVIAVGGGEAIMRPEWTRAVGADYIHAANAAARQGGVGGVQQFIGAGMPAFADGGIVGWIKDKVKGVGDFFKSGWDAVTNPGKIFNAAKDWALSKMKGLTDSKWATSIAKIPISLLTKLKDKVMSWFSANGDADGRVKNALAWAKTQAGKPYQWGGAGNPSWDCSGFMSGIQKVIEGKNPKGRLWSTFSFHGKTAPKGWVKDLSAPFMIGITNRGKGHTAGTLAGVNVESRGGDGVVVGKRARGARSSFFDSVYGFKPSIAPLGGMATQGAAQATAKQMLGEFGFGQSQWPALRKLWDKESAWRWNAMNPISGAYGIPQALPGRKMASAGRDWQTNPTTQIKWGLGYIKDRYGSPNAAWSKWNSRHPHWYDDGGYLPPGLSLVANGTGKPEPVFTSGQWDTLRANSGRGGSPEIHADVHVYVGDREITDIVRVEVAAQEAATAGAINTGRW
ncbi:hypothetical protein [Streptomyces asiaticus]|uniref:aggregation-promoting factor C-terminal-like domain-containing protein n=1 Tax=Streptomyces asiaticus TaxID=114695 RepID=UPI001BAC2E54|nr:hypothetical protein [Streptomyces asiaticus]